jgi:hypothetical protein
MHPHRQTVDAEGAVCKGVLMLKRWNVVKLKC